MFLINNIYLFTPTSALVLLVSHVYKQKHFKRYILIDIFPNEFDSLI